MTENRKRGPKTDIRARIIDAAEELFGTRGFDGVSMREIGVAAKSSNKVAVQYHFTDKVGLARAIYIDRLPAIETRRAALLEQATLDGSDADVPALVRVLLQPIADARDGTGHRRYAAFLLRTLMEGRTYRSEVEGTAPVAAPGRGIDCGLSAPPFAYRFPGCGYLWRH